MFLLLPSRIRLFRFYNGRSVTSTVFSDYKLLSYLAVYNQILLSEIFLSSSAYVVFPFLLIFYCCSHHRTCFQFFPCIMVPYCFFSGTLFCTYKKLHISFRHHSNLLLKGLTFPNYKTVVEFSHLCTTVFESPNWFLFVEFSFV